MNLQPLGDRIIVRPIPMETVRASGIVIPPDQEAGFAAGEIVAKSAQVGEYLRPGTRIQYSANGVQPFEHEGETLASMSEMSVLFAIDDFNVEDDS